MNCTQAQERFADLLDARRTGPDHAAVRAHLASCPACQREYATLARTLAALDALPAAPPSPALRRNFYAMLACAPGSFCPYSQAWWITPASSSASQGGSQRSFQSSISSRLLSSLTPRSRRVAAVW